ncbi:hypothetical protein CNMCM8980_005428 [Aspergillus fumigatiaffinis]|uniref:Uncharacterized protein n=1 Tax=Aspergillus fumigatiaffinis TaxID=340414 RepID=A0A8H4H9Q7_9EURO|nr:hypothetical protein CNMCM5878_005397 [Aspergillus fumigatiaffinis]KAF4240058.1 hypothetical protein CNMCM6805_005254 [Aspergillus fumigatiaffinis]KAF4248636.1 hypothetical protein CNMCM8980_005428 [Aspergillus fumigatiaffinis]
MAASFTCHGAILPSGNAHMSHPHHGSHSIHVDEATLASSITTTTSTSTISPSTTFALTPGYDQPASYLAVSTVPSLNITTRAISPCLSDISETKTFYSTVEVTEISAGACDSPTALDLTSSDYLDQMENSLTHAVGQPDTAALTPSTPTRDSHRMPKRKRTVSPPSSAKSPEGYRSTSRSTRRSTPTSRRSSLHSHRRAATTTSLTPSIVDRKDPVTKREDLLALHRESCRLFQDNDLQQSCSTALPYMASCAHRASSEFSSPPASPIAHVRFSTSAREPGLDTSLSPDHPTYVPAADSIAEGAPKQVTSTVIDWTSPSTRRREYKKIDRASTGVRGFWRRVAPRWCQFGDNRMPFFEEGKNGKGNYEGSVRRFRMDLPDEPADETGKSRSRRGLKFKKKLIVHGLAPRRSTC